MKGKYSLRRSLAKIAMHTMVAIFSLASVFAGTYAWFTLQSDVEVSGTSIKIGNVSSAVLTVSIHKFYGVTEDGNTWGFNPEADHTVTIDHNNYTGSESAPFEMGNYTLDDPNHPVLYLFKTDGNNELIKLITDTCYLANSEPISSVTVNDYDSLETYADNTLIKVTSDENHGGATTVYKYESGRFIMQWISLQNNNSNPLSSIIQSHSFVFNYNPTTTNTVTGNVVINGVPTSKTYMPFIKNQCLSSYTSNMSSFASIKNGQIAFSQEAICYSGPTYENGYIGIVFDYYPELIEEIYSYYLGNTYLNSGLGFSCDWSMEI